MNEVGGWLLGIGGILLWLALGFGVLLVGAAVITWSLTTVGLL